uniref:LRRCT domain-containing protein n=1 Tax=Dicentrarchus labrax TaxID=13489 RepID=A0A8P4KG07_DICLA
MILSCGLSFSGLVSLQTLDLSRNRLSTAPAEAFSYLSWLTNLNLDLNSWNCSCQLLELAAFLSTFIQEPDKTLYNGRRMVCVSADNPAVTTVLELTEANCVPSNQNITVQIQTRGSVTPQLYARDLAITAVICFIGGVGLTLLVVLIYYQVSRRKKRKESKRQKTEEEGRSTMANHHVNHLDVREKRRDLFLQANSSQPWDREVMALDARTDGPGHQFRSRAEENGSHFRCPDCSTEGQRGMGPNPMRWNNRINGGMEVEEEIVKRQVRMMTEEERRRLGTQQGIILSRDIPNKLLSHGNTNSSHPRKETFSQRQETLAVYREMGESYRTDMEGQRNRGHENLHCESCHRTYRPPEQNTRQGRIHTNMRDSALFDGFPSQYRQIERGRNANQNQFDIVKNTELRRETRNVTFDLKKSKTQEHRNSQADDKEEEERTSRDKDSGSVRRHKAKGQSSRLLKVKLNLNPLRKSKVHPKRKTEHGHSEKSSSKKSKDKRPDGKERGEREGKGKSGKKTKSSSEKAKKSTKTKGSTEDGEEEKEGGGQKSKITPKGGAGGQESTEGNQGENKHQENSQPADTTNTADQSASAIAIGQ